MSDEPGWEFGEGDEIVPGRYALRLLGGGYRYEAYLTWDEELLAVVVVKILRPDRVKDPSALRGLGIELEALRSLQHPVILRCFDADLEGPRPHLAVEFLEGPRLSTLLRKYGALAIEQAVPLATQLCSALHYMAGQGMVHLDVKPKNIIMGGPPRLIDLSIARTLADARRITGPVGTDAYMAPEQCEPGALGTIGSPADVWGLGVTLYEALAGRLPFPSNDGPYPQLRADPGPMPEEVPPVLEDIIRSCLAHRPEERPTARQVHEALEPLVAALPRRPVIGRLRPRIR